MKGICKCAIYVRVGTAEQLNDNINSDVHKEQERLEFAEKIMREFVEEQEKPFYQRKIIKN